MLAGDPQFVRDLDPVAADGLDIRPQFAVAGNTMFFLAADEAHGKELWKTDGTTGGTQLVRDILPGPASAFEGMGPADKLVVVGNSVCFWADDGEHGKELWKSDGTAAGTVIVKDVRPGIDGSKESSGWAGGNSMAAIGTTLYFAAAADDRTETLWRSDGTATGTVPVQNAAGSSPNGVSPSNLLVAGGTLYFNAYDSTNGYQLWKSDGTDAGTQRMTHVGSGKYPINPIAILGTRLIFSSDTWAEPNLWATDDSATGAKAVGTMYGSGSSRSQYRAATGGFLYYIDYADGTLWKTDGTAGGTGQVKDLYAASGHGFSRDSSTIIPFGGGVFVTDDKMQLWYSDGTGGGTKRLKGPDGGPVVATANAVALGGKLYFEGALNGATVGQLIRTDGTDSGTELVCKDRFHSMTKPAVLGSKLFFAAAERVHGWELWSSDGTTDGTSLFADVWRGTRSSKFDGGMASIGGKSFFRFAPGGGGAIEGNTWTTDGSQPGTVVFPVEGFGFTQTILGNTTFFQGSSNQYGYELFKTDGTVAGTILVKDIASGLNRFGSPKNSNPYSFTRAGNTIFFLANDFDDEEPGAAELWKTDGTAAGTVLVRQIQSRGVGSVYDAPTELTAVGNLVYWVAHGTNGRELWKSDGTEAGTVCVRDIAESVRGSDPRDLTVVDSTLFFTADDGVNGRELWRTDGTTGGTVLVRDIRTGVESSSPDHLTAVGSTLFFAADDGVHGQELWKTDGTPDGTVMVRDVRPWVGLSGIIGDAAVSPISAEREAATEIHRNDSPNTADDLSGSFTIDPATGLGRVAVTGTLATSFDHDFYRLVVRPGEQVSLSLEGLPSGKGTLRRPMVEVWSADGRRLAFDDHSGAYSPVTWTSNALLDFVAPYDGSMTEIFIAARSGGDYVQRGAGSYTLTVGERKANLASGPSALVAVGSTLIFTADDGIHGVELWRSDGTASGTAMVTDLRSGSESSNPRRLTTLGNAVYFTADDGIRGEELWKTDGTAQGTVLVRDFRSDGDGCTATTFWAVGGRLFLTANDGIVGNELWVIDPRMTMPAPGNPTGRWGDRQVVLSWEVPTSTGGSPITDYTVEYSDDGGFTWRTFADGVSKSTTATVTGLTNGTRYRFRVAGVNANGAGWTSTGIELTPAAYPPAPTGLAAEFSIVSSTVTVGWKVPALVGSGGAPITSYVLEQSVDGGATWTKRTIAPSDSISWDRAYIALSFKFMPVGSYVYRVAAVNAAGTGPVSDNSPVVEAWEYPTVPRAITAVPGDAQVKLTWDAPVSDGGFAITDYTVFFKKTTDSNESWNWIMFEDGVSTARTLVVNKLVNGQSYDFKIVASNKFDWTLNYYSTDDVVTATPNVSPLPSKVQAVIAESGAGVAKVRWTAPASPSPITDYMVQSSADGGRNWTSIDHPAPSETSIVATGLVNGTSYVFRVAASNKNGTGDFSDVSAPVVPATVADAATSLVATRGNGAVTLTWTAPVSNGGLAITDYMLQSSVDGGMTWKDFDHRASNATTMTVTGLMNGTSYVFRVAAVNGVGTGTFTGQTPSVVPATVADAITSLVATRGNGEVVLTWTAPVSNGGLAITDYTVQSSVDGGKTWKDFAHKASSATARTVTRLTNGTSYVFRVAAVTGVGFGAFSDKTDSTVPGLPAGAPTALVATRGNGQATLAWKAPSATGGLAVTDYVVQSSIDAGKTWKAFDHKASNATTMSVTGLTNGTSHVFRVAAVTAFGTGAFTPATAGFVPATHPDAATSLVASRGNGQVALGWKAPASNGGLAITDYLIQSSVDGGKTWTSFPHKASNRETTTVTGLANGTNYVFRIAAFNGVGTGPFTDQTPAVVPATLAGAPTALVSGRGNGQVTLAWKVPASKGGVAITDYVVQSSIDGGKTWKVFDHKASNVTTMTVTGLTNGVSYVFRVAAVNDVGIGTYTAATIGVMPATVPSIVTDLTVRIGSGRAQLAWKAPVSNGGSGIRDYVVHWSNDDGRTWRTFAHKASTTTSATISGFVSSLSCRFRVAAVNRIGRGDFIEVSTTVS